jgi:hypothetical protein
MINIPLITIAIALVICATIAKVFAGQPSEKANKSQKGEILKQLLAISEQENRISGKASSVQSRTPLSKQGRRPGNAPRKIATKISQPIRSGE